MLYLTYYKERFDVFVDKIDMIKRSLMLNLMFIIRTLFSALSDIIGLYMIWFVLRWLCLEMKFDFISATLGLFMGVILLILNALMRAIKFKYFGLMLSRLIIMFVFVVFGNNFYQMIVGVNTNSDSLMNMLIYLSITNLIIWFMVKLLDYIIRRILDYIFENNKDDFILSQKAVLYSGSAEYELFKYRLKTMNVYNIEIEKFDIM